MTWTRVNIRDVDDQAAANGVGEAMEARFPREALGAADTGPALIAVKPGRRQPFAHRHDKAEEIYLVLSGSGILRLDDEDVELAPFDAVRMDPGVARGLQAGPEGLEVLAFGPRHEDDAEMVDNLWEEKG